MGVPGVQLRYPRLPRAVDEAGQVFDVSLQMLLAGGGQLVPSQRAPVAAGLVDREVTGVLQLAQVGAQTAVLLLQYLTSSLVVGGSVFDVARGSVSAVARHSRAPPATAPPSRPPALGLSRL